MTRRGRPGRPMGGASGTAMDTVRDELETRITDRASRYLAESKLMVSLPEATRETFARKAAQLDLILDHLAIERLAGRSRAEEVKAVPALITAHRRSMTILGLGSGEAIDDTGDL